MGKRQSKDRDGIGDGTGQRLPEDKAQSGGPVGVWGREWTMRSQGLCWSGPGDNVRPVLCRVLQQQWVERLRLRGH